MRQLFRGLWLAGYIITARIAPNYETYAWGRIMKKALLAATLLLCAGNAYAADMAVKAPAPLPPAPSWTGFYIGINGGGAWGSTRTNAADIAPFPDGFFATGNIAAVEAGGTQRFNVSGGLAGVQAGYLYQAGPAIFGVEVGFDWSGLSGSVHTGPTIYPVTPGSSFNWNLRAKSTSLFTALGRVGPDLGMWFPYLTGGVAVSHLNYSANYVETFYPTNVTNAFSKDATGGVLGAGVEIRFAQNWMLRGEYLHMQFAGFGANGAIACTPGVGACVANTTTFRFNAYVREDVGRAALSYKF